MSIKRLNCSACGPVPAEWQGANHILHLFATIITGGLWLIPWIFVASSGHYVCPKCGGRIKDRPHPVMWAGIIFLGLVAAFVAMLALSPLPK